MTSPRPASNLAGILLFLAGVFFFAVNDALGKWLVADYAVGQLLLLRTVGAGLVLAVMIWRARASLILPDQRGLHLLRIACMAGDTFAFYSATYVLPLADVMTFYLAAPLLITALSVPMLGEKVGPYRWGAVLVGFTGVLIALRPSGAAISWPALVALGGATMFALGITTTRKLRSSHWLPLTAWQFIGAGVVGGITAPFGWVTPPASDLALMLLVGIVSMACFASITKALSLSPASLLAPFQYTAIVWAVLLGWLVWGDIPTPQIILGNAIIVGSGLFVIYREARRGSTAASRPEPIP